MYSSHSEDALIDLFRQMSLEEARDAVVTYDTVEGLMCAALVNSPNACGFRNQCLNWSMLRKFIKETKVGRVFTYGSAAALELQRKLPCTVVDIKTLGFDQTGVSYGKCQWVAFEYADCESVAYTICKWINAQGMSCLQRK